MEDKGSAKILQIGDFKFDYYDAALYNAFSSDNKIQVTKFAWSGYFSDYQYQSLIHKIYFTFQNRYKIGSITKRLNRDLLSAVQKNVPDIIFIWRGVHLYPSTLKKLQKIATVIGYNNDQTFSKHHPWWLFRLLKKTLRYYDHFFVYRKSDLYDLEQLGVSSSVFMPTFDPARIYPIVNRDQAYDVAFVGHYEDDGRDLLLLNIINAGYKLSLHGQGWERSRLYSLLHSHLGDISPAYDNYNEVLNNTKVCLSFLSKLNNDTYTRRTLEIPATKTVMLAEFTHDQAAMFTPDIEAVYFSNHNEALLKIDALLKNEQRRESIAKAGYMKVMNGSYQLSDRVTDILKVTENVREGTTQ